MEGRVGEGHAVHEVVERHGGVDVVGLSLDRRTRTEQCLSGCTAVLSVFADVSCRRVTPLFVDGALGQWAESMYATSAPTANDNRVLFRTCEHIKVVKNVSRFPRKKDLSLK